MSHNKQSHTKEEFEETSHQDGPLPENSRADSAFIAEEPL